MEKEVLLCSLVKLFREINTFWYFDSSCDGDCYYHRYTIITDKYSIIYDPSKGYGNDDWVNNLILVTIQINEGEINQEKLNNCLNEIEEAINRDLLIIRTYFNPHANYTYEAFGGKNWKNNFKIIDEKTIEILVKPYTDDDFQSMNYVSYHLLLLGSHTIDNIHDFCYYEGCFEDYAEEGEFDFLKEIRKQFLEILCKDNINLEEQITIYPGHYIEYDYDVDSDEFENSFPQKLVNMDEVFEKELKYYENKLDEKIKIQFIEQLNERLSSYGEPLCMLNK
jgi:hypothetical protein